MAGESEVDTMLRATGMGTDTPARNEEQVHRLARGIGVALMVGGTLWVVHFVLYAGAGTVRGEVPDFSSIFGKIDGTIFTVAIVALSLGLFRLGQLLRTRAAVWATAGMALATVAGLSVIAGLLTRVFVGQPIGALGGIGVLGTCLSATLLAIAALRTRLLSRGLGALLFAVGLLTFPLIIAITIPFGAWLPMYVVDELPFAASGVAWLLLGERLNRE
jgi:hypothetical protein